MGRLAWPLRPLPDGRGEVWRWDLGTVAELPGARAELRTRLGDVGFPRDGENTAGERLVLAFDELASNALRHGESPVVATVVAGSGGWLLDVSDRAAQSMPAPAVDRDPAQGGLGLHLVARLAVAHGWYVDGLAKHVWAPEGSCDAVTVGLNARGERLLAAVQSGGLPCHCARGGGNVSSCAAPGRS